MAGKTKKERRYRVYLTAFDSQGNEVESVELSTEEYYEGENDLIDNARYRSDGGICSLRGEIYGPTGDLGQKFENRYSMNRKLIYSRAEHADGMVHEHGLETR